jgi:hypothetical protein
MREIRRDHPMTVIIATHDPQLGDGDTADEAIRRAGLLG